MCFKYNDLLYNLMIVFERVCIYVYLYMLLKCPYITENIICVTHKSL